MFILIAFALYIPFYLTHMKEAGCMHLTASADMHSGDSKSFTLTSNLDPSNVRQIQQQDAHISIIVTKCNSKKHCKTLYYLDKHGVAYGKIKDGPNISHAVMAP